MEERFERIYSQGTFNRMDIWVDRGDRRPLSAQSVRQCRWSHGASGSEWEARGEAELGVESISPLFAEKHGLSDSDNPCFYFLRSCYFSEILRIPPRPALR